MATLLTRTTLFHWWLHKTPQIVSFSSKFGCSSTSSRFSSNLINSHVDKYNRIVTLTMQNLPVNSLSLEMYAI
jgi:hypothetical protein